MRNEATLSLRFAGFCEAVVRTAEERGLIPGRLLSAAVLRNEARVGGGLLGALQTCFARPTRAVLFQLYESGQGFVERALVGRVITEEQ